MKRISDFIVKNYILIIVIGIILLIPSIIGYIKTNINYNILVYLPESVDTIKGQHILTDEFHLGSYAFVMSDASNSKKLLDLEDNIKKIDGVSDVISIEDIKDVGIPSSMIPKDIKDKLYSKDNETIIMVSFTGSTSEESTLNAVSDLRELVEDANKVNSMTGLVLDTKLLSDKEVVAYVLIAVVLVLIVLVACTDSYVIPFLLLSNIGIAIIYNMGSNIIFGEISYITKAISAILQLGVTTDFSIFLYNQYKKDKELYKDKFDAMSIAISETVTSVLGSSLTTFAGFLALCTMTLTLGIDIGLVMAKGVLFGLICVLTLFPCFILLFDNKIENTKHKIILPEFKKLQRFILNKRVLILIVFAILLIPILYGNSHYKVYYKLDESLPDNLPCKVSTKELKDKFNIVSTNIILIDKNLSSNRVNDLVNDIKEMDGIDFVVSPGVVGDGVFSMLPGKLINKITSDKYQLVIYNSTYEIASDKLNKQVVNIDKLVKTYDKKGIVAGEGALMENLVKIADHDFKAVNYTSIGVVFVIMFIVLRSLALPILLIFAIEIAIFTNLAISFYMGVKLPFIASIVVGTIQLGATIDYAILMATTYKKNRLKYKKNDAMKETLSFVTPSIITSALCFFAATIGVGFYTKIDMIGSICTLLSRGSIISMFVVLLLVPSLLTTFDKVIMKTTKGGRDYVE